MPASGAFAVILWLANVAAEEVVTLTAANFDQHLQEKKFVLAEFYAPWCGHCKKLAPEFEKAAAALKSEGISLAKVDATEEKDLAKRFEVKGFPSLIWFENQKRGEYSGGRTTQTIVDWVRSMTGPAVTESSSPDPPDPEKPQVILKDNQLHPVYEQVAKENRRKASWIYQKTGGPLEVSLAHAGEETVVFKGAMENASLSQFVADHAMPFFGELNGDTFDRYLEAGKGLIWSLFPAGESSIEDIQKAKRAMMTEVAKKFRGQYFVTYTDTEKFKDAIDSMLGVTRFPTVAVQKKAGDKKKYLYSGEMTAEKIAGFVAEVDAGHVAPAFKSQPEPEKPTDDVKVVVASNLEKEVFTPDRDVLLEVYAPWCGHCKKLEPEYTKLAKKIRKEELGDLLTIAKIDGTANDSPVDEIDWSSFPTIFFVKAGGNATVYDGERTAKGLWKYIRKHATKAQEIRDRLERRKGSNKKGEEL